jgi:hypothetical protein
MESDAAINSNSIIEASYTEAVAKEANCGSVIECRKGATCPVPEFGCAATEASPLVRIIPDCSPTFQVPVHENNPCELEGPRPEILEITTPPPVMAIANCV